MFPKNDKNDGGAANTHHTHTWMGFNFLFTRVQFNSQNQGEV